VAVERRELNRAKLPRFARAELDGVGVLRVELRIPDEDVLLIEKTPGTD